MKIHHLYLLIAGFLIASMLFTIDKPFSFMVHIFAIMVALIGYCTKEFDC